MMLYTWEREQNIILQREIGCFQEKGLNAGEKTNWKASWDEECAL